MSLRAGDLGGRRARDRAPCSARPASALPGVCVQTLSGKPAAATLAAIREPMIPRPRKPIRSLAGLPGCRAAIAESSPTGRFDAQPLARAQRAGRLAGQRAPVEQVAPGRAGLAAGCARAARGGGARRSARRSSRGAPRSSRTTPSPPRWRPAPPEPRRSAYSITRSGNSRSSASIGRVQRVAHRHVHAARPVGVRARALAAAERLVVGEALVAERQVVHRPLALGAAEGARARGRRRARRSRRCPPRRPRRGGR